MVYEENLNKELVASVNEFNLFEGVIYKGITVTKKGKTELYYCKIKTDDWFQRLRNKDVFQHEQELKDIKV